MKKIAVIALALATSAAPAHAQINKVRPGLGDDPGRPVMRALQLSSGVKIDGPIMGADTDSQCEGKRMTFGSGGAVKACVAFCGSGKVTLPPGMMILSDTAEGQHGLLVENVYFTVPPTLCTGGPKKDESEEEKRRKRFIVEIGMYCLNESKSPSFTGMKYTPGGVTSDPDLLELVRILSRKKVVTEEHGSIVQGAIYSITEGRGLTEKDRWDLEGLPNKA